jgi:hypothetical protein
MLGAGAREGTRLVVGGALACLREKVRRIKPLRPKEGFFCGLEGEGACSDFSRN